MVLSPRFLTTSPIQLRRTAQALSTCPVAPETRGNYPGRLAVLRPPGEVPPRSPLHTPRVPQYLFGTCHLMRVWVPAQGFPITNWPAGAVPALASHSSRAVLDSSCLFWASALPSVLEPAVPAFGRRAFTAMS